MNLKQKTKIIIPVITGFLVVTMLPIQALAPGGSFSTSIACGNIQGSVSVSGTNATITIAGNWCEQGQSISVTATAGGAGTATVTAYTIDASNVANPGNIILLDKGTFVGRSSVTVTSPSNGNNNSGNNNSGGNTGSSNTANTPNLPDPEDETKSKDNDLKNLSIDQGELSPAFSKDVVDYTVSLPATAKKIDIKAEANDTKATVSGTGQKTLEPGDNHFEVVVVAENAAAKAYKIKVVVDEKPLLYTTFKGKKLGVVRNIKNAPVPPNFKQTTVKLEGEEIPAWTNDAMKKTIVYLSDDKNNKQFYLFEKGKLTTPITYVKILGKEAFLTDIPEKLQSIEGMHYEKLKIEDTKLMGWTFKDKAMKDYEVFYVMDLDGQYRYYQHEKSQNTIQLYSNAAAITQSAYAKQIASLKDAKLAMMIWAIGATVLLVGGAAFVGIQYARKHKKA